MTINKCINASFRLEIIELKYDFYVHQNNQKQSQNDSSENGLSHKNERKKKVNKVVCLFEL